LKGNDALFLKKKGFFVCGIAGQFNYKTKRPVSRGEIETMLPGIRRRGPDWEDTWVDGEFGFGTTRLAVIGKEEANQPIFTGDRRCGIVFNGEVYNYLELNDELSFSSTSDTRTLLEFYLRYGHQGLSRVRGMFAFAVFDATARRLFLARDQFGKKPLFIAETPDGLAFASSIRSLLSVKGVDTSLEMKNLGAFLSMGYTPAGMSPLRGISALPAASWRFYGAELSQGSFYAAKEARDDPRAADSFMPYFQQAVNRRLVSDVPIGIFLSGGMDSHAVLSAALGKNGFSAAKAFTLSTPGFENEVQIARQSCAYWGVPLEEVPVTPQTIIDSFDHVVQSADNLLANPPMLALDQLALAASRTLKVVLTGGGGDELFYGYPTWKADWVYRYWHLMPGWLNKKIRRLALSRPVNYAPHALEYAVERLTTCPSANPRSAHAWWRTLFAPEELTALNPEFTYRWDTAYLDAFTAAEKSFHNPVRQTAFADLTVWWQHMGLYATDAIPMGRSVEARCPFLDVDLLDWSRKVPLSRLYNPFQSKPLLRRELSKLVPPWVVRRPKHPFYIPLGKWMKSELSSFVADNLSAEKIRRQGLFDPKFAQVITAEHLAGKRDNSFKLLALLVLTRWHDLVYAKRI